ncbi:hypothetical protein KSP39_PZI000072 [Platanthera zijinensis]|uniref:Uncharacterized protein n=1 Tax=Platanthera zijinensis TaxID=2320716 RepID=A0AAP0C173_9ASPA
MVPPASPAPQASWTASPRKSQASSLLDNTSSLTVPQASPTPPQQPLLHHCCELLLSSSGLLFFQQLLLLDRAFSLRRCSSLRDYINPYDFSSRINAVIVPEFIAQGILSGLFLLTWQLIPFIIMAPISYYHLQMFWKKKHLIDVTEIFRQIEGQKKYRMVKLAFYFTMFILVIYRLVLCAVTLIINDDDESPLISGIY